MKTNSETSHLHVFFSVCDGFARRFDEHRYLYPVVRHISFRRNAEVKELNTVTLTHFTYSHALFSRRV